MRAKSSEHSRNEGIAFQVFINPFVILLDADSNQIELTGGYTFQQNPTEDGDVATHGLDYEYNYSSLCHQASS